MREDQETQTLMVKIPLEEGVSGCPPMKMMIPLIRHQTRPGEETPEDPPTNIMQDKIHLGEKVNTQELNARTAVDTQSLTEHNSTILTVLLHLTTELPEVVQIFHPVELALAGQS